MYLKKMNKAPDTIIDLKKKIIYNFISYFQRIPVSSLAFFGFDIGIANLKHRPSLMFGVGYLVIDFDRSDYYIFFGFHRIAEKNKANAYTYHKARCLDELGSRFS